MNIGSIDRRVKSLGDQKKIKKKNLSLNQSRTKSERGSRPHQNQAAQEIHARQHECLGVNIKLECERTLCGCQRTKETNKLLCALDVLPPEVVLHIAIREQTLYVPTTPYQITKLSTTSEML